MAPRPASFMSNLKKLAYVAALCLSGCATGYEQQPYAATGDRIDPILCQAPPYLGDTGRGRDAKDRCGVGEGLQADDVLESSICESW